MSRSREHMQVMIMHLSMYCPTYHPTRKRIWSCLTDKYAPHQGDLINMHLSMCYPMGKGGGFDLHEMNCLSPRANARVKCPHHRTLLMILPPSLLSIRPLMFQITYIDRPTSSQYVLSFSSRIWIDRTRSRSCDTASHDIDNNIYLCILRIYIGHHAKLIFCFSSVHP